MAKPGTFRSMAMAAAVLLAAGILLLVGVRPAEAAFPGGNGKIAFASDRDGDFEIYTMNPNGTRTTQLTHNAANDFDPSWSPNGTKITFMSEGDGDREIHTMNADGSGLRRLTNNSADDDHPAWSPAGNKIAFRSDRDGNFEIYTMNSDGSNPVRQTNNPAREAVPAWSPDGTKIAFSRVEGADGIWVLDPGGTSGGASESQLTTRANDQYPNWSPDGTKIAFSRFTRSYHIYAMDADGTNVNRLTFGSQPGFDPYDVAPAWSPNGTKITFMGSRDPRNTDFRIYTMNAGGTNLTPITDTRYNSAFPDWQPLVPLFVLDGNASVTIFFRDFLTLSGKFTYGSKGISGQMVALWQRPAGSETFAEVPGAEAITAKDGSFRFEKLQPQKNTDYRVRFAGDPKAALEPLVSAIKRISVRVLISLALSDTQLQLGRSLTMSGRVSPAHAGKEVTLIVKRDGKEVVRKSVELDEDSRYRLRNEPPRSGNYSVVARFPGDSDHVGSASPTRSFTVVR